MLRRSAYLAFLVMTGVLATVLGAVAALTWTGPGRALLARLVMEESARLVNGTIAVGELTGNFYSNLTVTDLEVRDSAGGLLLAAPRVELRYSILSILAGRIVLDAVTVDQMRLELVQHRSGRMNYEKVLRIGEGEDDGGPPGLLELRQLRIREGFVQVSLPWNYPGHLTTQASSDSALAYNRAWPGRRIVDGPEGLTTIRTIEDLNAHIPSLRISTPNRDPVRAVVNEFAGRVSDPLLDIRAARGTVETAGDSLVFALVQLELPRTEATGRGRLDWPQDTLLFNMEFSARQLALADIRFISPDFPDYTGRAVARVRSVNGTLFRSEITELRVGDATSSIDGRLVALAHQRRGLGFEGLALQLRDVDLDAVRPYLDTLPLEGRLSGTLRADGYFDDMQADLDWVFRDAAVPGEPLSRIVMAGRLSAGAGQDFTFRNTDLPAADLDLATVRNVAPAVLLEGRLSLSGQLDGPWTNATFTGLAEHRDGDLPPTLAEGWLRLDTREPVVRLAGDLAFRPLALAGLQRSFPGMRSASALTGRVWLEGSADSLQIDADMRGDLGWFDARGVIRFDGEVPAAEGLLVVFDSLNLERLDPRAVPTRLQGAMFMDGGIGADGVPAGEAVVYLGASTVREVALDSARAYLQAQDGWLVVDTVEVRWPGGGGGGAGTLGWAEPDSGSVRFAVTRGSLAPLDSLLRGYVGSIEDTTLRSPLEGLVDLDAELFGSLEHLAGVLRVETDSVAWDTWRIPTASGAVKWDMGAAAVVNATVRADSLIRGNYRFNALRGGADGPLDSLHWWGGARGGPTAGVTASGRWLTREGRALALDTVFLDLGRNTWTLREPALLQITDSLVEVGLVSVAAADGSGLLEITGTVPGRVPGSLEVRLVGLDVQDLYGLLQQDTTGVGGNLAIDIRVGGTARAPTLRGSASARGPVFGEVRAPLARAVLNYENRLLQSNLTFWRTGEPILEVEARLPVDLAFQDAAADRFLPGELDIRAFADSLDLAVVEALTTNLRRVRGVVNADARIGGSWAAPRLAGQVVVSDAGMTVPSLGVRYEPLEGTIRLDADSVWFDNVAIRGSSTLSPGLFQRASTGGGLAIGGSIRVPRLSEPELRVRLTPNDFLVMDVRDFLTARVSGAVELRGPFWRPVLTGTGRTTGGVLYFQDLVSKSVVNLWDPEVADLVDTLELRRLRLGAAFQSRFLDSLAIQNLNFSVEQDFWLRSNEANVQLVGNVIVNKLRRQYRVDGTLNTPRGTYSLKIGPVVREFVVQSGTVRYFGTPDLNADVNITATHQLRTTEPGLEDVTVTAQIQGTILVPRLALETDIRPTIPERDIIGLLLLGRLGGGAGSAQDALSIDAGIAYLLGALSSEASRALIADAGVPLDMLELRVPFEGRTAAGGAGAAAQVVAGWALGRKWFVTLNAGVCTNDWTFNARNFGASLEYRLSREWRALASAEPGRICSITGASEGYLAIKRYQFGADLRWDREY